MKEWVRQKKSVEVNSNSAWISSNVVTKTNKKVPFSKTRDIDSAEIVEKIDIFMQKKPNKQS